MLPAPGLMLGLPKFDQWFPGQEEIFQELVAWMNEPNSQFACAPIPTGFGKSILGMLTGNWKKTRMAYVTSTKGLQSQLMDDFEAAGLREIKGRGSYVCFTHPIFNTDTAPCTFGVPCDQKAECDYFSALDTARNSQLVNTNYAYWMAQHAYSDGLSNVPNQLSAASTGNPFGLLVLDEGHTAAKAIESYMKIELDPKDLDRLHFPDSLDWNWWQNYAKTIAPELSEEEAELYEEVRNGEATSRVRTEYKWVKELHLKIAKIATAGSDWVVEDKVSHTEFTPIDPKEYNRYLFLNVPKILVMSAVMTPRAAKELGIENPTWIEAGSPFDPERAPFTHIKTTRVDFRMTDVSKQRWVNQVDNILRTRSDRKGIIHTGSYDRAWYIYENSRFKDRILIHTNKNTRETVAAFKAAGPGAVLVSPSVTTGYDFPGDQCEFIIWGKVPYPYTNTPLAKARQELDDTYADWEAMKALIQGAGRGNRKKEDRCEIFIIDDHFGHFWQYAKQFAPQWFHDRMKKSTAVIPQPLMD